MTEPSTRQPDPGVSEGVCAIIYAAPRTELKGTSQLNVLQTRSLCDLALMVNVIRAPCPARHPHA
jgi:vacuolar protein sorting-associated protein IST1